MPLFSKNEPVAATVDKEEKLRPGEDFKHIAFIMDGNGRWATKKGMPSEYGHRVGAKVMKQVCT